MRLYEWEPIETSYHPACSGIDNDFGSGVIRILVYHLVLQDHVIKGPCNFMGGSSL